MFSTSYPITYLFLRQMITSLQVRGLTKSFVTHSSSYFHLVICGIHLCLQIAFIQRKNNTSHIFMTGDRFITWSRCPPTKSFLIFRFQGAPKPLTKTSLGCKLAKRLFKFCLHISLRDRERNHKFPQVHVLRKVEVGGVFTSCTKKNSFFFFF